MASMIILPQVWSRIHDSDNVIADASCLGDIFTTLNKFGHYMAVDILKTKLSSSTEIFVLTFISVIIKFKLIFNMILYVDLEKLISM